MVTSLDLATDDISNSRLKLRTDLLFSPRRQGSEDGVHIEDSRRGKHFYVGYSEYAFLSQFDGQTAFAQALTIVARKLGPAALSKAAATDVFHWLLENELAYTPNRTRRNAAASSRSPAWWRRLNPFWLKVPLGNPDALLGTMVGGLGWLFSVPAILATVIAVIVALLSLAEQWDRFSATAQIVFAPMNWLWMAVAWALLKIVHELGHGIACKRLGGEVREAGVVFILLAPLTYVDVTSSWRCASKWQRIGVAAAGMYVELIVALCAYFAWQHTDSELAGHLLYNVVLMASVMTLVFNVNPLMRFDGYYILADWLEIPNLYSEASLVVREHLTRLFWGRVPIARRRAGMTRSVLAVYGWSAVVWRIVVCASLSIVAGALWAGAGIVLVGGALVGWLGMPAYLVMREVWRRWQEDRVSLVRAGGVLVLVGSTGWAMLLWTPNPLAITAPGVVEFEELKIVRSATPGFVDTIHVEDGEWVAAGTPLITLRNDEVTNRRRDLELEIEQARIQERIAVEKGNSSEIQVVRRDREALESRLAEVQRQFDKLVLRSPSDGRVVARNLQERRDTFVQAGEELLVLGNDARKELVLSIADRDVDRVVPQVGDDVRVRVGSRSILHGKLKRVEPQATLHLPHPALAATAGGSLPVTASHDEESGSGELLLATPRYRGVVQFQPEQARDLFSGELGIAQLGHHQEPVLWTAYQRIGDWIREKKDRAEGRS